MQKLQVIICLFIFLFTSCNQDRYQITLPKISSKELKFSPVCYTVKPEFPSPALSAQGRELVLIKIQKGGYTWMDATVENGNPFDYKKRLYGKGNQLLADEEDFPFFARTGLHSEKELSNTKLIHNKQTTVFDGGNVC